MSTGKRVHKIFSPTIMFNPYVKSCWIDNVRSVQGGLPVHQALAAAGQYAIHVEPLQAKGWYVFGVPFRKDWVPLDASTMRGPKLCFEALSEQPVTVKVDVRGAEEPAQVHVVAEGLSLDSTDDFAPYSLPLECAFLPTLRLLTFAGSSTGGQWLLRNVRVEET